MDKFEDLKGKILAGIEGVEDESEKVIFTDSNGVKYMLFHKEQCCEYARVYDTCGSIEDILNEEVLLAECVSNEGVVTDHRSETWTFYKLSTIKGDLTIRWLGESNGYYSETVDFKRMAYE